MEVASYLGLGLENGKAVLPLYFIDPREGNRDSLSMGRESEYLGSCFKTATCWLSQASVVSLLSVGNTSFFFLLQFMPLKSRCHKEKAHQLQLNYVLIWKLLSPTSPPSITTTGIASHSVLTRRLDCGSA